MVRAPDCGSGGRRFDSVHPPHMRRGRGPGAPFGMSPSGKAQDFDSCSRGFESRHPSHRRSGLHIVRSDLFKVRAHSFRRSSSQNRTRFAGLRFCFWGGVGADSLRRSGILLPRLKPACAAPGRSVRRSAGKKKPLPWSRRFAKLESAEGEPQKFKGPLPGFRQRHAPVMAGEEVRQGALCTVSSPD